MSKDEFVESYGTLSINIFEDSKTSQYYNFNFDDIKFLKIKYYDEPWSLEVKDYNHLKEKLIYGTM